VSGGDVLIRGAGSRVGTFFTVERMTTAVGGAAGEWEFVASTGRNNVVDDDVSTGLRSIVYRVRAERDTADGMKLSEWSETQSVRFGKPAEATAGAYTSFGIDSVVGGGKGKNAG
jgi:hypothetical protein